MLHVLRDLSPIELLSAALSDPEEADLEDPDLGPPSLLDLTEVGQ